MADLTRMGEGARRAAEAVLRVTGGRQVLLRVPRPGTPGDVLEQLGLATAEFDDVEIGPCVLRPGTTEGAKAELLISAREVARVVGGAEVDLALPWFAGAAGVVVDGQLLRILAVSYRDVAGVPYVYQLELQGADAATV